MHNGERLRKVGNLRRKGMGQLGRGGDFKLKKVWGVILCFCWVGGMGWSASTPEQHQKLIETCRWLSQQDLAYAQSWQPPGHPYVIRMDCSNTVRYIVWKAFQIDLPRTASDQYLYLKKRGKVCSVPLAKDGTVDSEKLVVGMRSGDLLFWEWTYNVPRDPPISHVMIYLGQKKDGQAMVAGSSQRHDGERGGGVDVYTFNPNAPSGNAHNFFNFITHRGRLVAYARPTARTGWAERGGLE